MSERPWGNAAALAASIAGQAASAHQAAAAGYYELLPDMLASIEDDATQLAGELWEREP